MNKTFHQVLGDILKQLSGTLRHTTTPFIPKVNIHLQVLC